MYESGSHRRNLESASYIVCGDNDAAGVIVDLLPAKPRLPFFVGLYHCRPYQVKATGGEFMAGVLP